MADQNKQTNPQNPQDEMKSRTPGKQDDRDEIRNQQNQPSQKDTLGNEPLKKEHQSGK